MNPFSDQYVRQELAFYGQPSGRVCAEKEILEVDCPAIVGRCDDYLSVNFRIGDIRCPRLRINGAVWMSLTPMELQSLWVPIQLTQGKVATAGLGLGYFALRAAAKKSVQSVDVYETSSAVIQFFKTVHVGRRELKKINVIQADVREALKGKAYDVVFMGPYCTLLPNEVLSDIRLFCRSNHIGTYRYWGQELVVYKALEYRCLSYPVNDAEVRFFKAYMDSPGSRLKSREIDLAFVKRAIRVYKEFL